MQQSQTGTIVNLTDSSGRVVLHQILLKPNEKKMALMVIRTPKDGGKNNRVSVKISENIKEKEMGGIVFIAQGADQKLVLDKQARKLSNLFNALNKKFNVKNAEKIVALLSRDQKTINFPEPILESARKLADLEQGTLDEMSKLMEQKDFDQYRSAIEQTMNGIEKKEFSLIRESQDRLIYSTIPLFLRNIKITGI